jgi:E3 ubiquitin-protein ligase TRIP12
VLVEPLATIHAIAEFLTTRVLPETKDKGKEKKPTRRSKDSKARKSQELGAAEMETQEDLEEESNLPGGPKTPSRLSLWLEGKVLDPSVTIFQALQRALTGLETNQENFVPQPLQRLWEKTHVITYNLVEAEKTRQRGEDSDETKNGKGRIVMESPYIAFLKERKALHFGYTNAEASVECLSLLQVLNALNSLWIHFIPQKKFSSVRSIIPPNAFVNNKLNAKLLRQLQDPLTLCSSAFPSWCSSLVPLCSFLFPFDSKRLWFNSTSFGIARALQVTIFP